MNGAPSRTDIKVIASAIVAMRTANIVPAEAGDERMRSRSDRE